MFKYYCLDWVNVVLVPLHIWLLGNKNRHGFLVGIASCVFSLSWSYMAESYANIVLAFVLLGLHIRGWILWEPRIYVPLCRRIFPHGSCVLEEIDEETRV